MKAGTVFVAICLASLFLPLVIGRWWTVALLAVSFPPLAWCMWKELS